MKIGYYQTKIKFAPLWWLDDNNISVSLCHLYFYVLIVLQLHLTKIQQNNGTTMSTTHNFAQLGTLTPTQTVQFSLFQFFQHKQFEMKMNMRLDARVKQLTCFFQ